MKRAVKIIAVSLAVLLGFCALTVGGYVLYVVFQYNRIDDFLTLDFVTKDEMIKRGERYTALTYNIGFGAYDRDFSFFMDSGVMEDGTQVTGRYGKAVSEERVTINTEGACEIIERANADFVLLQETDEDSDRARHVRQREIIADRFSAEYGSTFAVNFHSAYLFYPLHDPHGKNVSGLMTLSRYQIAEAVRRQYPVDSGFAKFFDLDRCFSVHRIPLESGETLTLIHSHMSAYDEGGLIRKQQLALLNEVLAAEREEGNYVIVGGDFNHDIANSAQLFPRRQQFPAWVHSLTNEDLAEGFSFAAATNAPTCRAAEIPYEEGVNYTVVIDGFIVSENVTVHSVTNLDYGFLYSDHNPVLMEFSLN